MDEMIFEDSGRIELLLTPRLSDLLRERRIGLRPKGHPRFDTIVIPKNIRVEAYCNFAEQREWFQLGACSYSHTGGGLHNLRVGRFTSMAGDTKLFGERHPSEWATQSTAVYNWGYEGTAYFREDFFPNGPEPDHFPRRGHGPVTIGNDVWVGQQVTFARDITIGDGAIIAAGSVVTKDIAPYTIVGGVSAKPIKLRFPEEVIADLIEGQWWNHHPRSLYQLDYHNPARFARDLLAAKRAGALTPFEPASYTWQDIVAGLG